MLNVRKNSIKALLVVMLICGLSHELQAVDWSAWNPRNIAANLYQRLSSFSNPFSQRSQLSEQLREAASVARENIRSDQRPNNELREKLELIKNKTGDQEQLWNQVKSIIEQGANVNTATKREIEEYGQPKIIDDVTALHLAATDKPAMINFLIAKGANTKQKNADGYTYEDIIKASKMIAKSIKSREKSKFTQSVSLAESKLKLALNDIYSGKDTEQNWEMVRNIISQNPYLINTEFSNYWTALHLAVSNGNTRMVGFLMGYGANPTLYNGGSMNAFDLANSNRLLDENTKESILKLLSKEFSSAQFGSPDVTYKSLSQIVQERAPSFNASRLTKSAPPELEYNIRNLVEKYRPRSPQLLEEEDVPEAYTSPIYY